MAADPARTFQQAATSDAAYTVLMGRFSFDAPPQQPVSNDAQSQSVVASFEGQGLSAESFVPVAARNVTLITTCAGPWCGGFPQPGQEILAFVQITNEGYRLELGPCPGSTFPVAAAPLIEACMRGEECASLDGF